jgi:hypothetical protein
MQTKIEVHGLNETLRDLRRLNDKEIPKAIRQANKAAAEMVAPMARALAPQRSGRLAASVKARATQRSGAVVAGSKVRVPYAGPIHWGWPKRGIAANKFMLRALDARIHAARERYVRRMNEAIARFNRG